MGDCEVEAAFCRQMNVTLYPTWQINGQLYPEYYSLEKLSEKLSGDDEDPRPHKAATQRYRVGTTGLHDLSLYLFVRPPVPELVRGLVLPAPGERADFKGSLRVPDLFHRFSRGDHVKLYHCTRYTTAFPHRVPRYGIGAAGAAAEAGRDWRNLVRCQLVCLHTEAAGGPGHHGALYPGAGLRGLRGETGALPTDERHTVPHVADERPAVPGVLLAGEALGEALGWARQSLKFFNYFFSFSLLVLSWASSWLAVLVLVTAHDWLGLVLVIHGAFP